MCGGAVESKKVTSKLHYAFSTGNWNVQRTSGTHVGVTQLVSSRMSRLALISAMRRVNTMVAREGKSTQIRQLHLTHYARFCASETPEGSSCLTLDTMILLKDGREVPISEVIANHLPVLAVDPTSPNNTEGTEITNPFQWDAASRGRTVHKVTLITGASVKATDDHPFLTPRGWVEVRDMKLTDRICIRPSVGTRAQLPEMSKTECVLSIKEFRTLASTNGLGDTRTEKYITELTQMGLLPLFNDSAQLPVLARIAGYLITDGTLWIGEQKRTYTMKTGASKTYTYTVTSASFSMGTHGDAEMLSADICDIGFADAPISKRQTTVTTHDTGREAIHTTFRLQYSGAFPALCIALGFPSGKRVTSPSEPLPKWVMLGSLDVKREFVAGLWGGDGASLTTYPRAGKPRAHTTSAGAFIQHKATEHVESLRAWMIQVTDLLGDFNISTTPVIIRAPSAGSAPGRLRVKFSLSSTPDNLVRFVDNIGYRYSCTKSAKAAWLGEYLRYKKHRIDERVALKQEVFEYFDAGLRPFQIAARCGMKYRQVASILEGRQNNRTLPPRDLMTPAEFEQITDPSGSILWIPIKSIEQVPSEVVADFTTISKFHSFVANNFVSSNCGLIKNLACTAYIRIGVRSSIVTQLLTSFFGVTPLQLVAQEGDTENPHSAVPNKVALGCARVLVNGDIVGTVQDPAVLVRSLRDARRSGTIPLTLSIVRTDYGVLVHSDAGCVLRPLFVVEQLHKLPTLLQDANPQTRDPSLWRRLERAGVVEFLDTEEEAQMRVAVLPSDLQKEPGQYTHLELHPISILGFCAALIPFSEHNQGPRNMYQASMAKQATCAPGTNFMHRWDGTMHVPHYSQKPLVQTVMDDLLHINEQPMGTNLIVAICTYTGYNQEDSVVFKRSFLDRGGMRSTKYTTHRDDERRSGADQECFEDPTKTPGCVGIKYADYSKLGRGGHVRVGERITKGTAIIGKTMTTTEIGLDVRGGGRVAAGYGAAGAPGSRPTFTKRDRSTLYEGREPVVVDKVMLTTNRDGMRSTKVRLRTIRVPQVADKVSSRHGQKGTIGKIMAPEDMPFISAGPNAGMIPDAIISPHCIPSRMTLGHIIESLLSKLGAATGHIGNGTPFQRPHEDAQDTVETIGRALKDAGMHPHGYHSMTNGITGEPMEALIFMGPVFYQRLKHMVEDKIHGRTRGPTSCTTRQPMEGRAKKGGLRLGEMERDCLLSHGASDFLRDRMLFASDKYEVPICTGCGHLAINGHNTSVGLTVHEQAYCRHCPKGTPARTVEMPYACKLLTQELAAMHVGLRYQLEPISDVT